MIFVISMLSVISANPALNPLIKGWHVCRTKLARNISFELRISGTKNEPKPKLSSPDIFWWGGGLPREGAGAKKFGMSLETQGNQTFLPGISRDFLPGYPGSARKV